uniref:Glutathione S-transferase n=1 Tax=Tetradesmus obliquus TaxID=3088 RepID=A0A383VC85_TETOB|eukprot:jgi/Sobl393_1/13482/SZX63185.1
MVKIIYFGIPGRAEVARLTAAIGKIEHEDKRVDFEEWQKLKQEGWAPFGQLPVLEVDGKYLAQSAAIDRYLAQRAGLLPADPWKAAQADQAYFFCEDVWQTLYPSFKIKDPEEKVKARQELLAGALADKLKLLSKVIEGRAGKFLTGGELSHGDLAVFCNLSTLKSGWLDGIPKDVLNDYPVLKDFRNSVAAVPAVAAFYADAKNNDDIRTTGFRADA